MRRAVACFVVGVALLGGCGEDEGGGGAGAGGMGTGGGGTGGVGTGGSGQGGNGGDGGAGGQVPVPTTCAPLAAPSTDCAAAEVICVDDDAGATQEMATIQEAADAATPGTVVVVHEGSYAGFQIDVSGTVASPIVFYAAGDVVIGSPAGTGDGIRLQNVSHVRIEGFTITSPPERCIAARGATPDTPMVGLVIADNTCTSAGVEGFYLSEVSDSLVQGNAISGSGASGDTRSHGIYLANAGSDGTTIACNVIQGAGPAESNGIHMNGDLSVGGDGIISDVIVEANVIHDNAQNGLNLDGVQSSVFRNNLIYGNGRNALRAYAIDGAEGPRDLLVVSNTLVGSGGAALKCSEDLGGHVVFDNILFTLNPDSAAISVEHGDLSSAANALTERLSPDGDATFLSLAEWQAMGFDAGSIAADPATTFVDSAGGNYALLAAATAVDAALSSFAGFDAPNVDLAGVTRPQGAAIDMGAYELESP